MRILSKVYLKPQNPVPHYLQMGCRKTSSQCKKKKKKIIHKLNFILEIHNLEKFDEKNELQQFRQNYYKKNQ